MIRSGVRGQRFIKAFFHPSPLTGISKIIMEKKMEKNKKINVGILGATGLIGQVFVKMLSEHPRFDPVVLTGSGRGGELYTERVRCKIPLNIPQKASKQIVSGYDINILKENGVKFVFSALPSDIAGEIENELRENGFYVFSNASAHRYDPDVPVLIPDINPESLGLIRAQGFPGNGFIVTNPNCSTTGLAVALHPLMEFGIEEVTVSTYQAISGAGYPGLPALDIMDSVIPHIKGEEEKMGTETKKILGIDPLILATCIRVPTRYGHLESVWVRFSESPDIRDIITKWADYQPEIRTCSLTERSVKYLDNTQLLRNSLSFQGDPPGMQVYTGGIRKIGNRIGFNLMINNLIRGGAGGSVANAELFHNKYGGFR